MGTAETRERRLTLKGVQEELCHLGLVVKRTSWGTEFMVRQKGLTGGEYFTDDLQDALDTGRAMARDLAKRPLHAGDMVRCLDESSPSRPHVKSSRLTKGDYYTVRGWGPFDCVMVMDDTGKLSGWYPERFALVKAKGSAA